MSLHSESRSTGTSSEHKETIFYCGDDQALAQKGCGPSHPGDTQKPSGDGPGQTVLGEVSLPGLGPDDNQRSFQSQPFCDSVIVQK